MPRTVKGSYNTANVTIGCEQLAPLHRQNKEDAIKEENFHSDRAMLSSIMKVGIVGAFADNLVYNELTGRTPH